MSKRPELVVVRSAPLNVTPAVGRYVALLRSRGFSGAIWGMELDYGQQRPPVQYVDRMAACVSGFEGAAARIAALLRWQWFQLITLLRWRPRVIQFCDVFSVVPVLLAKLLLGCRTIFDIRDVAKLAVSHRGRVVAWMLGAIEGIGVLCSDEVVVVDAPLVKALPETARPVARVIPNTPGKDLFEGLMFLDSGALRVSLAGFISHRRNLKAWSEVLRVRSDVHLDVYGTVADKTTQDILDAAELGPVEKVDHVESLRRLRGADAIALMYDPAIGINRFAAPNKYYEGLMLGKPIVCAVGMGLASEVSEWRCGCVVEYGNVEALLEALDRLREPGVLVDMGYRARSLYEAKYLGRAEQEMEAMYRAIGLIGGRL